MPARWNRYTYVINNPILRVDIDGLSDVIIHIQRLSETVHSTTSSITVSSNQRSDIVRTGALEPPGRPDPNGNGTTRMPEGVYPGQKINPRTQSSVGAIVEVEVPGHTGVRIHPGNTPSNTEGCILPGTSSGADSVSASRYAVTEINDYLNSVIQVDRQNGEATDITVVMTDPGTAALQPLTISPDPLPATSPFSEIDDGVHQGTALPSGMMQSRQQAALEAQTNPK